MSYGTIYKLTDRTYFNEVLEVYIKEEDYAGAVTNIYGTSDPVEITWETPSDFLLDPVNGSAATLRLMSTSDQQFVNIFTANNRKYQVQIDVAGSTKWKGYIDPDYYQEPYTSPPYPVEFIATDQLGYLSTVEWDQTGGMTLLEALWIILDKTDLGIDLYEGINLYEDAHDATSADSPLDQTWFQADVYTGKTYYDALKDILLKFGAIIKQSGGAWTILRPEELISDSAVIRSWDFGASSFTLNGDDTFDYLGGVKATTTATNTDLIRLGSDTSMWIKPAWQRYTITHDYGKRENLLLNGDFSEWLLVDRPYYWTPVGGIATYSSGKGDKLRLISDPFNTFLAFWSQGAAITTDRFKFSIDYDIFVPAGYSMTVRFRLVLNGTKSWDFNTNTWDNVFTGYSRTFDNTTGSYAISERISVDTTTIDSSISPSSIFVYLQHPVCPTTAAYVEYENVTLRVMNPDGLIDVEEFVESQEYETEINPDNNYKGDNITLYCADYHGSASNLRYIYYGAMFSDVTLATQTLNWSASGSAPFKTLVSLLQATISDLFKYPQQVLSGTVHSKLITVVTTLQETYNSNRLHYIKRASWSPLNGIWNVEAHEIGTGTGDYLLQENGDKILQETGDGILL